MKKWICMLLTLGMIASCANAQVETIRAGREILVDEQFEIDLDGDGQDESLVLRVEGVEYEENLALYAFGSDGDVYAYPMMASIYKGGFVQDLDGDGRQEIIICGDWYSDDYVTWCIRYTDGDGLSTIPFAATERGGILEGYAEYGYGLVTAMDGAQLTLTGSQDILGTWMMDMDFILQDGRLEVAGASYRAHEIDWEYEGLVLARDLAAQDGSGNEMLIKKGDEIMPVRSDIVSWVEFETREGLRGKLDIAWNEDMGWGFKIGGVTEDECFEWIPYAD